jgi:hypothetical protein
MTPILLLESHEQRQRRKWVELAHECFDNIQKLMETRGGPEVVDKILSQPDISDIGGGKVLHSTVDYAIRMNCNLKSQSTVLLISLKARKP